MRRRWRFPLRLVTVLAVMAMCVVCPPAGPTRVAAAAPMRAAAREGLTVLFLATYNRDLPSQIAVENGLDYEISFRTGRNTVYFENLEVGRLSSAYIEETFPPYLAKKYANVHFDVVIASGTEAANFVAKNHGRFPDSRRIYADIFETTARQVLALDDNAENLVERYDIDTSLREALRVSGASRIVAIGDSKTISGQARLAAFRRAIGDLPAVPTVEYMLDERLDDIVRKVASLPPRSVIFYLLIFDDGDGRQTRPYDAAARIAAQATAPVFSQWESLIGSGIVGGYLFSGEIVGRNLGKIIRGEPRTASFRSAYDWREITRWGIPPATLPAGATIFFKDPSVLERYRWQIGVVAALLVAMTALVVVLAKVLRQRNRALDTLSVERSLLADRLRQGTAELRVNGDRLAEALAFNEEIIAAAPIGMQVFNGEGPCVLANEEAARMVGAERGDLQAQNFREIASWRPTGLLDAALTALAEGRVITHEFHHTTTFGQEAWLDCRAAPLVMNGVPHLLVMLADISDHKRGEEAMIAAREAAETSARSLDEGIRFIRMVTDHIPGMVGYWDADLRCRFANKAYLEWFGRAAEAMIGVHIVELMGPRLFALNEPFIRGALAGERQSFERTLLKPSGETGYTWAQYIPDLDSRGDVRGFFVLVSDITTIKQAEFRLQEANEELSRAKDAAEAASSAKSAFLANMSHEIRTPLNAVLGLSQVLERTALSTDQRDTLQKIAGAGRALLGILNDILDLSKVEAGQMTLESTEFEIQRLIDELATVLSANTGDKPIQVTITADDDVPRRLIGDPLRLRQVLINLAGNAVKFTEKGEVTVRVAVAGWSADGDDPRARLRFSVRDTGIGIPAAHQRELFSPFTQADVSTTRRYGGTGLGLTISKRLVELMGGAIGFDSVLGQGSEFWFVVLLATAPLDPTKDRAEPATPSPQPAQSAGQALAGAAILLVEDNFINQEVARRLLEVEGATVTVATDGAQAVAILEERPDAFDIVLMDVQMPVMDGFEATRRIRRDLNLKTLPIIAMTAGVLASDRDECLAAGMNDFIGKPFELAAMAATVARHRDAVQANV